MHFSVTILVTDTIIQNRLVSIPITILGILFIFKNKETLSPVTEHWLIKIPHLSRRVIKNYHLITQRNRPVGFRAVELEEAELQALCSELSQYYYDMLTKPLNLTSLGL